MTHNEIDFFISYAKADESWAEWIAWHLEQEGYTTVIQAWDFRPGHSFPVAMLDASGATRRTIAVMSPDFLASDYAMAEWSAAFAADPIGRERTLVPVLVRDCRLPRFLTTVIYINLVGSTEQEARSRLLDGLHAGRNKSPLPPGFPGAVGAAGDAPHFPGMEQGGPYPHETGSRETGLEQIQEDEPARTVLAVCAHLAVDGIPRALLDQHADAILQATPERSSQALVDASLRLLLDHELLTCPDRDTLIMRRVTQRDVRERQSPKARQEHASIAVTLMGRAFPDVAVSTESGPTCQRLVPHALSALDHARELELATLDRGQLASSCATYFVKETADYSRGRELAAEAVQVFEHLPDQDRPEVAIALGTLGIAHHRLRQLRAAREAHEHALEIAESSLGPKHPLVATTLNNLAVVLDELGEPAKAQSSYRRALALREELFGPDDASVAITLANLGVVERRLGDASGALLAHERALAIAERVLKDPATTLKMMKNLVDDLQELGQLPRARKTLADALLLSEAEYGPEHIETAGVLCDLGIVLRILGDYEMARSHLEQALAIAEREHGLGDEELARILSNLGPVYFELRSPSQGFVALNRAVELKESIYGRESPEVALVLLNTGIAAGGIGDVERARAALTRASQLFGQSLGKAHPHTQLAERLLRSLPDES